MTSNRPLSIPQLPRDYFARLQANGYAPIPTADKQCYLKGWPSIVVDAKQATLWGRQRRWPAIGLRLDPPLCVVDFDVADESLMRRLRRLLSEITGQPLGPERIGNPPKTAFFMRYSGEDGPFNRRQSCQWSPAPESKAAPKHRVEVYGGGAPRYFGAFGPHSHDEHGRVIHTYHWPNLSPLDVNIGNLSTLTKDMSYAICNEADRLFSLTSGLFKVESSRRGDAAISNAYDLTPETVFTGPYGEELSLDDLITAAGFAKVRGTQMRVTGSFTGDRASAGSLRGLVSLSRDGLPIIHDLKTGVTHRMADSAPGRLDAEWAMAEIRRLLGDQ